MATFNRISDALLLIPSLIRTDGGVGPDAGSAISQDGCGHVAAVGKGVHECGHDLWRDTTDLCSERNWLAGWTDEIAPGRQGLYSSQNPAGEGNADDARSQSPEDMQRASGHPLDSNRLENNNRLVIGSKSSI